METLFPQILFLGPQFAPVILRIGAAIGFALFAHNLYRERAYLAAGPFLFGVKPGKLFAWIAVVVASLLTLALAAGMYTQGAAILGFISAVKSTALAKKFPESILPGAPLTSSSPFCASHSSSSAPAPLRSTSRTRAWKNNGF